MLMRILDLCSEFKRQTSGHTLACGRNLLGAMTFYGLPWIEDVVKESMRQLAMCGGPYTAAEKVALLAYCQTDVDALEKLLPAMLKRNAIDLPRALLRGRHMVAAAKMEFTGVPSDADAPARLLAGRRQLAGLAHRP
jgi:DNA polymerase-1